MTRRGPVFIFDVENSLQVCAGLGEARVYLQAGATFERTLVWLLWMTGRGAKVREIRRSWSQPVVYALSGPDLEIVQRLEVVPGRPWRGGVQLVPADEPLGRGFDELLEAWAVATGREVPVTDARSLANDVLREQWERPPAVPKGTPKWLIPRPPPGMAPPHV